jgi:type I phosphodiesterase/nucleotide pyrophosphatase
MRLRTSTAQKWPKSSPGKIFDQRPVFDLLKHLDVKSYVITQRRIVGSDYSLAMGGRAERLAYADLNGYFEKLRATLLGHGGLGNNGRKFVYAYWPDLDLLAHQHGIASEQVRHHFHEIDQGFAALLEAIHASDSLVIVTADHGFIDSPPERLMQVKDHPPLAEALALPLCGEPRVAYCYVRPGKTRQFESYVSRELSACCELHRSEDLVAQGYFGLGTPSPRLLDRIGDYALLMKEDYVLKDFVLGEGKFLQIGVHGGLSPQELYVPLIAAQA